jgi:hypothetical protein
MKFTDNVPCAQMHFMIILWTGLMKGENSLPGWVGRELVSF